MIHLSQAIVVEGRYDKKTLQRFVDAPIFETGGFGVMNDRQLLGFLRRVAEKRGLIILTDSDGAGFVIRNYLKGALPQGKVFHAYIPDIPGKERRKKHPGKEGLLGVEGMDEETLLWALERSGVLLEAGEQPPREPITRADLYALGLNGKPYSAQRRQQLSARLGLPAHLGTTALLDALNILLTRSELAALAEELD